MSLTKKIVKEPLTCVSIEHDYKNISHNDRTNVRINTKKGFTRFLVSMSKFNVTNCRYTLDH